MCLHEATGSGKSQGQASVGSRTWELGHTIHVCLDIQDLEALTDIWIMGTQKICPRMQSWKQQEMY